MTAFPWGDGDRNAASSSAFYASVVRYAGVREPSSFGNTFASSIHCTSGSFLASGVCVTAYCFLNSYGSCGFS